MTPATFEAAPSAAHDTRAALRFITCGSVDDGKSTLIGRLLLDSQAVLQDQLSGVTRQGHDGETLDLAQLTDGLSAEREQGITIDVAYRYFSSPARKFIIGDAPGHEQYTRNMVTAASSADAAVVLVDATKLDLSQALPPLLPQTRRHSLLLHLLRLPSVIYAVNKLDAVPDPALAHARISDSLRHFAQEAGLDVRAVVPISALHGWNVVTPGPTGWCGHQGPTLLHVLETLPVTPAETGLPLHFPVQWVEKPTAQTNSLTGSRVSSRRVFWGRVATGAVEVGQSVRVFPSGQRAKVAEVWDTVRQPRAVSAGQSAGVILDRELDVSRGDWLLAERAPQDTWLQATVWRTTLAWLDDEPLVAGRTYWALHGHRWVKARVQRILHRLDIHSLSPHAASELPANAIGEVELMLQQPLAALPHAQSRALGSLILVDMASHRTAAAAILAGV